jgi:hypothetical protein
VGKQVVLGSLCVLVVLLNLLLAILSNGTETAIWQSV